MRRAISMLIATLAGALGACFPTVDGERTATRECPKDEVCSSETSQGLSFIGTPFWDDGKEVPLLHDGKDPLLGPVLAGGTFEVGLATVDRAPLPRFVIEIDGDRVFSAERSTAIFGPLSRRLGLFYPVDGFIMLTAIGPGSALIRIVDPGTGELFDRVRVEAYEIDDISITLDLERTYVIAGCEEQLAVSLFAKDGDLELRAADQSIQLRAEGEVRAVPGYWDVFDYQVPEDRAEVTVEVEAGGRTFERVLEVRTLAEATNYSGCPGQ